MLTPRTTGLDKRPALHVEFYMRAVEDKKATRKEGRPMFRDTPYCRIRFPGDKNRVIDQPATVPTVLDSVTGHHLTYAERFPEHWKLFQAGQEQTVLGTPLSELPFLTEAKRMELRAQNVHTAEQLAGVPDGNLPKMGMGTRSFRDQARAYLERAAESASNTAMAAENADLKERLAALEKLVTNMRGDPSSDVSEATAAAPADDGDDDLGPGADFENWDDDSLAAFIKDTTGSQPRSNASHASLVEAARAAYKAAAEKTEAA